MPGLRGVPQLAWFPNLVCAPYVAACFPGFVQTAVKQPQPDLPSSFGAEPLGPCARLGPGTPRPVGQQDGLRSELLACSLLPSTSPGAGEQPAGSRAWSRPRPLPRGWSSTFGAPKPAEGGCSVRPSPAASPQPAPAPRCAVWRCFVVAAKPHGLAAGTVYSLGPFQGAAEKMPTDEEKGSLCSQPARAWNNAARKNILSIYTACPSEPPGSCAAEQGKVLLPSPGGSVLMEKRPGKLLRPALRPTAATPEHPVLACWGAPTSGCHRSGQLASPSSAGPGAALGWAVGAEPKPLLASRVVLLLPVPPGGFFGVTWETSGPGVRLLWLPARWREAGLEQGGPQPCARDPVCAWQ